MSVHMSVRRFVGGLRLSGFKGDIMIAVDDKLPPKIEAVHAHAARHGTARRPGAARYTT